MNSTCEARSLPPLLLHKENPVEALKGLHFTDFARNLRYTKLLDEGMDQILTSFQLDQLPFGDPKETPVRWASSLTGYMVFCWANPLSRYHGHPDLLRHAKSRLLDFAENHKDGVIVFRDRNVLKDLKRAHDSTLPIRDSHENSWYIEPLMLATWWLDNELSAEEHLKIKRMIRRAADMHAALPIHEANNRGVIRNAILCMAGHFLGDRHLIDMGIRDFHREPVLVFNEKDGQINEGTGPDANYSGTTFIYLYIYRVFSGDSSIDAHMVDALKWCSWTFDPRGYVTLFGASTRMPFPDDRKILDYLPALERYAAVQPHFSCLIEHGYLEGKALGGVFHAVNPLIWAMLEHGADPVVEDPDWFQPANLKNYNPKAGPEFMYANEGYSTLYFMFRQDYHSSVTVMGRSPYKGFQHWSYRNEPPVIWPTFSHASKTLAWGMDTSHFNVSGVKFRDKVWVEGPPHILVMRFENVWHHYVLTRTTTLLLISSCLSPREDVWVMDKKQCGTPFLGKGCLTYPGRQGRMFFSQKNLRLEELDNSWLLRGPYEGRTHLYAFSNGSFQLLEFNPEGDKIRFSDDMGAFELEYELRFFGEKDVRSIGYDTHRESGKSKVKIRSITRDEYAKNRSAYG